MKVLAGDIGGTNTRLALFEVGESRRGQAAAQPDKLDEKIYPSGEHASLEEIVRQFLDEHAVLCGRAAFGIAGPVRGGRVKTTNLPWIVEAARLSEELRIERVLLLNDLEANAWGLAALGPSDFETLAEGRPDPNGNAVVVSAGTGLGEAGLYWDGEHHRPFATEGGHVSFAPSTELEIELLRWLQKKHEHVSWERIVSGPGLVNLYEFLLTLRAPGTGGENEQVARERREGDPAAAIARGASGGRCAVCREALDWFVRLYGAEAGNFALKVMATGGVVLGGGIAPKIRDELKKPAFLEAFRAKGRMRPLLESMPVRIVLNDRTALLGAALAAAR